MYSCNYPRWSNSFLKIYFCWEIFNQKTIFCIKDAFINLVYPFCVERSYITGVILRIFLGISHSGSSTAMTEAWSKWAPKDEKSFLCIVEIPNTKMSNMDTYFLAKQTVCILRTLINFSANTNMLEVFFSTDVDIKVLIGIDTTDSSKTGWPN